MIKNKKSIEQNNIKKVIIAAGISFIVIVLTNIISYKFLPEYILLKSDGSNTLSKNLYVIIIPALLVIANYINIKLNNRSLGNSISTNIILPILNLYIIFAAIK